MSVEAMALVLHHSHAKGTDKVILLGIANHHGDGGAWPSLATLATYGNVSVNAARAALRRLEALGEVQTHRQAGGRHETPTWARPNRYDVLVTCPPTCDRSMNHRTVKLPKAPSDLWIDPPTSTGGGTAQTPTPPKSTGGAPPLPTGGEPSTEPATHDSSSASTTDRTPAPASGGPCSVCGKEESACTQRAHISGHTYTPRRRTA